jgi:hypothetical protein
MIKRSFLSLPTPLALCAAARVTTSFDRDWRFLKSDAPLRAGPLPNGRGSETAGSGRIVVTASAPGLTAASVTIEEK